MGTKMSPSYANMFMGQFEEDFVYTYKNPAVWKWFIDNCFCIWEGSKESLEKFVDYLNSFDPNIKVTYKASKCPPVSGTQRSA